MKKIAVVAPYIPEWDRFEKTEESEVLFQKLKDFLISFEKEQGEVWLLTGMGKGAETLAAMALLCIKGQDSLKLECVLPYEEQAAECTECERDRYFYIIEKCDKETLLQTAYTEDAEYNAYRYMVESADIILTFGKLPLKVGTLVSDSKKEIINL